MSGSMFIGGANDGKRIEVPDLPRIRVPLPPDLQEPGGFFRTEDYRKEMLATRELTFTFYVAQGISIEVAVLRLLEYYSPKPNPPCTP